MIIDPSGRGPTMRQLLIAGVCGIVVIAAALTLLMARYKGYILNPKVEVTANLTTTGDGLPAQADVKFRGVLVGAVKDVSVAAKGELQQVHINMKPDYISDIPANVTARVVPSNLFAVTSVELVYNGPDNASLKAGSQIAEDHSQGTIALQDTLTTVRTILNKIDPMQLGRVLSTLSYALDGSGRVPGSTVERLNNWFTQVRAAVPDPEGTLNDFSASFHALNQSAPDLMTTLSESVKTAQTIADKRSELAGLITGTSATIDKVNNLFARNPDVGKQLTSGTGDMFGALTEDPDAIPQAIANLNASVRKLSTTFHWGPQQQMIWNLGFTLTPYKPYDRSDCPRYGDMAGPSCGTAPVVSDIGPPTPALKPRTLDASQGLPKLPPMPGLPAIPGVTTGDTAQTAAPQQAPKPGNPFAGTPLEGLFPQLPGLPGAPAAPAPQPAPAAAPASDGQKPTAGPIAYYTGRDAMSALLGRDPTTAEYLLLSSILRGGTLQVSESGAS
ncbi:MULTISPECIES: MlaD family protein [Nocardia]|uniref:MlaD family protein n=1 Tax=Nocardia TaxID=1817 RepID=UPI0007E984BD|nr:MULTISPECIES: MCE family protein [Nocardia]MBF6272838.1 MCE family protein [Nocardia nova]OBA49709.1 mammalian cell entry protein [Nocardia sp. 852002-51101_SCH5132738]OBB37049.1 mammalian cell entry protein [Nocardia sp. 852002-51244_SCH5132740]OBF68385.1 mammalian cell entry protein [Mycobacterium sp. 852002-51759_SCH5129042]